MVANFGTCCPVELQVSGIMLIFSAPLQPATCIAMNIDARQRQGTRLLDSTYVNVLFKIHRKNQWST